jgi:uncharacterized protein
VTARAGVLHPQDGAYKTYFWRQAWYARQMSPYLIIVEMQKLLGSLDTFLGKAVTFAESKKFDANVLLQCRLAPDMFPLVRQVQATCDQAKYAAGRTTGREMPVHDDSEQTISDLRARIAAVATYLATFGEQDFAAIGDRTVTTPRWEGKSMTAEAYLLEHAQPNFFFHLSMTYAILRHNGVDVGKRDYLGALPYR